MNKKSHCRKKLLPLLIVLTWCWLTPSPSISETEAVGEVVRFIGMVHVEREGKSWQVQVEEPIHLQDRLQTGADSRVEIVFADRSRVRIAPDSTLEITEYLYQPDQKKRQSLLSLWSGKARFIVADLVGFIQKGFVVKTPNGIAGVRGTDFIVEVREVAEGQAAAPGGDSYNLQQVLDEARRIAEREAGKRKK
jgi:hypothetical protein